MEGARLYCRFLKRTSSGLSNALKRAPRSQPRRLLVVDFNALHNGVVLATVEEGRVLRKGVLRPDVDKIRHLQRQIARLDSLCAERGDL